MDPPPPITTGKKGKGGNNEVRRHYPFSRGRGLEKGGEKVVCLCKKVKT